VPLSDIDKNFDYICNYLGSSNNKDKLVDFLGDLVNKDYLDSIRDPKIFDWLAKAKNINTSFKKKDEVKSLVIQSFLG